MAPPDRPRGLALLAVVAAFLASLCLPAQAATFFVSQSQGNDANTGLAQNAPWKTLNRVLAQSLNPGDTVLLRRGDAWRESLIVNRSGTQLNPITFGAYGTGALPLLDGSDPVGALNSLGSNKFSFTVATPAEIVVLNGTAGRRVLNDAALAQSGDWFLAGNTVTLRSSVVPETVHVTTRQFGIVMNLVRDVHLADIAIRHAYDPAWIFNTDRVRFERLEVSECAGFAGFFLSADTPGFGTDNAILDCTVSRQRGSAGSNGFGNNGVGIFVFGQGFSVDNRIEGNTITDSGHEGIAVLNGATHVIGGNSVSGSASSGIRVVGDDANGNIVERNEVFGNCRLFDDRFGIDMLTVGNNNIVRYNYAHEQEEVPGGEFKSGGIRFDGGDFTASENQTSTGNMAYYNVVFDEYVGINCFNVSNLSVFNNTVIDCTGFGMAIHAVSTAVPEGNIAFNNVVRMPDEGLFFERAVAGTIINNNVYEAGPGAFFVAEGDFETFDTWRNVHGFDLDGVLGPLALANPEDQDFRPTEVSPMLDIGLSVGLIEDFVGNPVPQGGAPDAGAYEFFSAIEEGEGVDEGAVEGETSEGNPEGVTEGTLSEGEGTPEGTEEGSMEGSGEGVGEGIPEGVADGEGLVEGEAEGIAEGLNEGAVEGEGLPEGEGVLEGEGVSEGEAPVVFHAADQDGDLSIGLSELLRVVQLFWIGGLRCNPEAEQGFDAGVLPRDCAPHSGDFAPQDWRIRMGELLRIVQLYNAGGYSFSPGSEDSFAPDPG
jgi:parallel beta-helix repeat protein